MKERKYNLRSLLVGLLLFILLFLMVRAFFDNLSRLKDALRVLNEKESVVANLKVENDNIKKRIEELDSDMYIERQLRDNLGMAKEGETVIIIPDDEELAKLGGNLGDNKKLENPVWKQWLDVFRF